MDFKEIQDLLKLVEKLELSEFKMKDGEFELSIRTKNYPGKGGDSSKGQPQQSVISMPPVQQPYVPPSAPAQPPAASPESGAQKAEGAKAGEKKDAQDESNLIPVKSPIVGTFYRSPSPDKPAYVKVGDTIEVGTVVCIVEAMKLFNEIESEVSGKIVKVVVEDAQPVEYDQVLFLVDPNG
ncbi:MAG: acetyl-CoA carboxylase biotin carboxyl carrier protein [Saprospiraceae bacterium]|nr:acetyl-CoA carboxylase biotin carboxyl carrier protein [Saprospiraceae bacterium]